MALTLDPFDVKALEQSVNDSAVRVSTIWVSFLVFGLYLVVAAGGVTHRQLMLEDPVKLPALNIDLPLVAFFVLAPLLFVILHAYVLVQVLLLARTAAAYNEALERNVVVASDRARVRQRLANTLFAQMFAGSPREREGLLGAFLRLMAWITLAIAPVLVLLTFEVRFLPYHGSLVTWSLRVLIALDLTGVLLLWRGVLDARRDITWRGLVERPAALLTALLLALFAGMVVTFPGERHTHWMRFGDTVASECNNLFSVGIFTDRLSLEREVLIDTEKLAKIESATKVAGQKLSGNGERTRHFEGRDLSCGRFGGTDLRRADFSRDTNLRGADLSFAQLQGADLSEARLHGANLRDAELQGANLSNAELQGAYLVAAQLQGANLSNAQLRGAVLTHDILPIPARLQGANLSNAELQGANLREAGLQDANLGAAWLQGADLSNAQLQGANLNTAQLLGANLGSAQLQGADLSGAQLQGANLTAAQLQGAKLTRAQLQGAKLTSAQLRGASLKEAGLQGADLSSAQLQAAQLGLAQLEAADLSTAQLQGALLDSTLLTLANLSRTYVWRTSRMTCDDAQVTEPQFDKTVKIKLDSGGDAKPESTLVGTDIEAFIEQTVRDVPESAKQTLQGELRARLITEARDDMASERVWRACATRALTADEYGGKHAKYLVNLACHAEPSRPYQKFVALGVYRNWALHKGDARAAAVARGLLGLDGKPCPEAALLAEEVKKKLRMLTGATPAD
jgi:uncharacterized protein YjbI with pentapeptide repeats